jgi:putative transposase
VACDFFTVETILLRRFYVFFFIAHASRRIWLAGSTQNPTSEWVTSRRTTSASTSQTKASASSFATATPSTAAASTRSSAAEASGS